MQSKMLSYILGTTSKVEILRVLYESDDAMTGRRIASTANISPRSCQLSLDSLVKNKAIFRKAVGRAYSYTINREHRVVWELLKPLFDEERAIHKEATAMLSRSFKSAGDGVLAIYWKLSAERKSEAAHILLIAEDKKKSAPEKDVLTKIEGEFERRFGFATKIEVVSKADFITKTLSGETARKAFQRDYTKVKGQNYAELIA